MTDDQAGHQQLLAVVARSARMNPEQRDAYFHQQLGGDVSLIEQARRLAALVEEPTCAPTDSDDQATFPTLPSIPGFELIELIGHGGMGSVFRARQLQPEREVAIKLIRADRVSVDASQRLAREAQFLGRLDHPAIARIHAAGQVADSSGSDQPWLAMELIHGLNLQQFLESRALNDRAIVALFLSIAEGVEYAHQQGVIHRDLKPANILVDQQGQPHILDFGVARFSEIDPAQASTLVNPGELVGTLGYMAPEQLDGRADTRSDVYALGVMLYRALGRVMPIDLQGASLVDALGRLGREEPQPLRLRRKDLPIELEALVMHALEREPDQRYGSAAQLRDDLRRFLQHRPLLAQPPGRWRRLRLFVRRHRVGVAMAGVVSLSLIAGAAVSLHFGFREAQARAQAELRSEQLEAVNRFIRDMLMAADPDNTLGEQVTLVETLTEAARILPLDQSLDQSVRAELHRVIGSVMLNLGRVDDARRQLTLAVELGEKPNRPEAAPGQADNHRRARLELGRALLESGQLASALALIETVESEIQAADPGSTIRMQAGAIYGRALLESGRDDDAKGLVESRLAEAEAYLGSSHVETLILRNLKAVLAGRQGKPRLEADIQRRILADREALFGPDHPQTLSAMNNLAKALFGAGQSEDAETLLRETLDARARVLGPEHPSTMITRNNLAAQLIHRGALDEAEPLAREVLDWHLRRLGPLHPNTLTARNILAYLLEDQGNLDEAEMLYRDILAAVDETGDDGLRVQLLAVRNNLAMLLLNQGRLDEAERQFDQLLADSSRLLGPDHLMYAIFSGNYGLCLHRLGRVEEAVDVLSVSLGMLETVLGPEHERTAQVRQRLADASDGLARP